MHPFFHIWILSFTTLALAVVLLTFVYRLLGGELGMEGVLREAVIVLVASGCHALVIWAVSLIGAPRFVHIGVAAVIVVIIYIATHLGEMDQLEASIIGATQVALYLVAALLSLGP